MFGGAGGDAIAAGGANNIVFGDYGLLDWLADGNAADIDLIGSLAFDAGGADAVITGSGHDIVIGGTGADQTRGRRRRQHRDRRQRRPRGRDARTCSTTAACR